MENRKRNNGEADQLSRSPVNKTVTQAERENLCFRQRILSLRETECMCTFSSGWVKLFLFTSSCCLQFLSYLDSALVTFDSEVGIIQHEKHDWLPLSSSLSVFPPAEGRPQGSFLCYTPLCGAELLVSCLVVDVTKTGV